MRSRRKNKFFFNMVEILLAIGVLAIGFSAILGLFPVAIKMVRNSQTETLVADAVGDLQSYYYSIANIPLINTGSTLTPKPQFNGEYWYSLLFYPASSSSSAASLLQEIKDTNQYNDYITGSKAIAFFTDSDFDLMRNNAKGTVSTHPKLHGPTFLNDLKNEIAGGGDLTAPAFGLISNLNLFRPALTGNFQTFYLIAGEDDFKKITTTAQILVWISQMDKFYKVGEPFIFTNKIPHEYGVILNIEASWPINIPYTDREKRFYQFIIANPKKIN